MQAMHQRPGPVEKGGFGLVPSAAWRRDPSIHPGSQLLHGVACCQRKQHGYGGEWPPAGA